MKDSNRKFKKRYYYDDADRLTKVEQGPIGFGIGLDHNYVLEYAWNAASQLTQMKLTIRTQSAKTWDYAYLDDGEMDTVTNPDSDVTDHQYLTDGRLKKIVLDSTATRELFYQDTNDSHAYVTGKNSHLRKTLDKTSVGLTISSFAYELDAAGIRRSITDKAGKYRAFGYDPKYQLKAETFWTAKTPGTRTDALLWNYDGNGNRLTQHDSGVLTDYVYGDNNQMTDAGAQDFTFDHFGNTVSIVGEEAMAYDFEGHMKEWHPSGVLSEDSHEYDGNGRRMRSKLDGASNWTNFIHDELTGNLICEYTLISGTFTIKALNNYGLGLISTNRDATIRYFHFDGLGSTAHLTDSSQNITDSYTYDAFGVPCVATEGAVCVECLESCETANDLDELRKILDKLFKNRPTWKNPQTAGDCLLVPGYGAVFQNNCAQCCNRLEPDPTSRLRDYCDCMCAYVRGVYKPAPNVGRQAPEQEPCGREPKGGGTCK